MYKDILKRYLKDLASGKPAPGGGSAAALIAATGAALISMVANFTVGKDKYKSDEREVKKVLSCAEDLCQKLLNLVDEDAAAYQEISPAYKLPKQSSEQKRRRDQAIQQGLKQALNPPLEVCKESYAAIKLCPVLVEKGNTNLITDVGVAARFLEAAFKSALLNVQINLKGIKDEKFIVQVRGLLKPMEEEIEKISQAVNLAVERLLRHPIMRNRQDV